MKLRSPGKRSWPTVRTDQCPNKATQRSGVHQPLMSRWLSIDRKDYQAHAENGNAEPAANLTAPGRQPTGLDQRKKTLRFAANDEKRAGTRLLWRGTPSAHDHFSASVGMTEKWRSRADGFSSLRRDGSERSELRWDSRSKATGAFFRRSPSKPDSQPYRRRIPLFQSSDRVKGKKDS